MKIFITGSTGYIGHRLMLAAVSKGHTVHALVRNSSSTQIIAHQNISFFKGDITEYNSVLAAMEDCDAVMHAAGITQLWHPDRTVFYRVNVGGTKNI
jgi:nucleoside-diphosphate-sugar epimerase